MNHKVLAFLVEYLNETGEHELPAQGLESYRYLDHRHIDSFGLIHFIVAIEDEFDIQINPEDSESDKFRTLGGLSRLIEGKR